MNTLLKKIAGCMLCLTPLALVSTNAAASPIRPEAFLRASNLGPIDDGPSPRVSLGFEICYFGQVYDSVYVNNNGNLTFAAPSAIFTPSFGLTGNPIIAPFFADVDTRGPGSGVVTYGTGTIMDATYGLRQAFAANYEGVGYFPEAVDKTNSFQVVLIDLGGGDFEIEFNYGQIQWETGGASGGTNGLGGASARVGLSDGAGTTYEVAGSGVNGALLDTGADALIRATRNDDGPNGTALEGRIEFLCRDCVVAVSEPGTLPLVFTALGAVALIRRRPGRGAARRAGVAP